MLVPRMCSIESTRRTTSRWPPLADQSNAFFEIRADVLNQRANVSGHSRLQAIPKAGIGLQTGFELQRHDLVGNAGLDLVDLHVRPSKKVDQPCPVALPGRIGVEQVRRLQHVAE